MVARSQAFSLGSRRFRVLIGSLDFVSLVTGYSDYENHSMAKRSGGEVPGKEASPPN